jgi:glycosyltransferase involved in cell wall biosynthesis
MKISVFIPTYNEEKILFNNITKINTFLSKHFDDYELIIVDDNSNDGTSSIKFNDKHIKVVRFTNGPSRRENLGEAMKLAKFSLVMYMDLDLAIPIKGILKLVQYIQQGNDVVIGSRRLPGADVKRSQYRLMWSTLYHTVVRSLFTSNINDYQCGFKLFKRLQLLNLLKIVGYDVSKRRGWFWDAELLLTAEKIGYKIKEIPVVWREGKKSSFSLSRELKTVYYILWRRLNWVM